MPPLKEYKFQNIDNSNIVIVINAYSEIEALEIIDSFVLYPPDFKQI